MIKTIRTIKMMNNGKSAQREPSLLCTSHEAQTVRLGRTTTQARADHQSGWAGLWRSALLLLVMMMTLGVGQVWGQVEITTADDIANGTKKLYLIQTNAFQSFYMTPKTIDNTLRIMTNNILGNDMLWYFLDAGKDNEGTENEIQYYYIVSYSENKYICHGGGTANTTDSRGVTLVDKNASNEERCKFYIELNETKGTTGFYNIDAKGKPTYFGLNKQNGSSNDALPIRLTNDDNKHYINDSNSKWKFIAYNETFTWPASPFTSSTDSDKRYFKIQNVKDKTYYISISTDETPAVTFAKTESDRMVWYLKEVQDPSDTWFKYYYIINPAANDEYMYYSGDATNGNDQTNAVCVKEYDSTNEDRYQFVVVQAARGDNDTREECYAIIPKKLLGILWASNSIGPKAISDGANMGIIKSRGDTYAQWTFESTGAWADPEITCDEMGTITITREDGAEVYYTTNGDIPTEDPSLRYDDNSKPTVSAGKTTINARVIKPGKDNSNVVTKTIVYNPTITLTAESYTYTGSAQNPVSSVDYYDPDNSANDIHFETTQYTISYKKGTTAVDNCTDAGEYTIILNDVDGDDFFVCGTKNFTIKKAPLSATVSLADWAYNETAATPSVSGNSGNGAVTYAYKVKDASNDTYTSYISNPPTEVGTYTIKATIEETANYREGVATANFRITKIPFVFTVSMTGWTYGETASSPSVSNNISNGTVTYAYKVKDADDATYSPSLPSDAGDYTVKATIAETASYAEVIATNDFTIARATLTASVALDSWTYGETAATPSVTGNTENGAVTYTYKVKDADDATYSDVKPSDAGTYTVKASIAATTNYEAATATTNFTIAKATLAASVTLDNWTYGEATATPLVTGNAGGGAVTYTYKVIDADDATYSETKPTDAGTYTVKASIAATTNYEAATATSDFTIAKATLEASVTLDGWTYGETAATPSVTGNTEDGAVTFMYKVKDAADDTYTETQPTNAGSYTVKALIATTTNYLAGEATADFEISRKSIGDGTTPIDGITVGIDESNNNIIVTGLTENDYSITESTDEDGNQVWTITGTGNYGGSVKVMRISLVFYNTGVAANPGVVENVQDVAPFQAPTDMKSIGKDVYIVTGVNLTKQEVKLKKISYAPKDIPVLLLDDLTGIHDTETGALSNSFTASPINVAEGDEADTSKNILKQVTEEGGLEVGFAQVFMFYQGKFLLTTDGTMPKGKFYFDNPYPPGSQTAFGARLLKIVIDDTTGMEDAKSQAEEERSTRWYTLDGRSLSGKPTKKGLYLWNGRLVVIK